MEEESFASVPVVRVCLLQSVKLLPHQSKSVLLQVDGAGYRDPLLLEYQSAFVEASRLLSPTPEGVARLVVVNWSGFTQVAELGDGIGEATDVTLVTPEGTTSVLDTEEAVHRGNELCEMVEAMLGRTDLPKVE